MECFASHNYSFHIPQGWLLSEAKKEEGRKLHSVVNPFKIEIDNSEFERKGTKYKGIGRLETNSMCHCEKCSRKKQKTRAD